ncbi:flagellar basal body rod protein FlgC [bacterium DOLZORAL124_64_63]|nr:MAG: flagellar basal body rod protein FlgC [bacterium DOLZORAL124_64_63]
MNLFTAMDISAAGLSVQRTRLNIIAENLANIQTTRTSEGGPYRRRDVVFEAVPLTSFNDALADAVNNDGGAGISSVRISEVVEDPRPPVLKYDPSHPDADADGYVAMPNVKLLEEMVNMISASRGYEANAAVVQTTGQMALRALEIIA